MAQLPPLYCNDSQNRIPPEFFPQGKAVFCNGKPYLAENAKRLNLKPDATPPAAYAALYAPQSAAAAAPATPPAAPKVEAKPAADPHQKIVPQADTTLPATGQTKEMLAELRAKLGARQAAKPEEPKKPEPAPAAAAPKAEAPKPAEPAKATATAEAKPVEAPVIKPAEPAAEAKKPEPAKPAEAKPAEAKPAAPAATPAAAAAKPAAPATPAAHAAAKPADAKPAAAAAPAAPKKPEAPRILAEARLDRGEPLSTEELLKIPVFEGIPANQLERLPGACVKRTFKKGEIICREGEYGSTAFYILSGTAEVFINAPISGVRSDKKEAARGGLFGIVRRFTHGLTGRKTTKDPNEKKYIPIDAPIDLSMENPIAEMHPQDLFGEMTCLSFYPRSATVRAKEDCVMLEMLRNVLQILQKNKKFKEQLEKAYRERALGQHLRSVPILRDLDEKFVVQLKNRVELVDFDPGETIIKQGDAADAFYLIRVGCVKVSQNHPGGELVLSYLGRGEYFGEMGLLKGGKRTATCTALDHVEVVKIKKADFDFMLSWYEGLRAKFEDEAEKRDKATRLMAERAPGVPLDDFLGQGLMHAQSLLLLDLEKCTRCDECVRACSDSHDGVTRLVREGLRFDKYLVPTSCRSCMDPVCMIGCPVGSIRRKESLEIIIEDWCIGCGICAKQCPYGNIGMHPFEVKVDDPASPGAKKAEIKEKAVTCDLCTELNEPSCVYACPHDAAHRVNAREFFTGAR